MICRLLLVPAGVPVLVSLLLSSLVPVLVSLLLSSAFPQDRGLFDLLVPPGSGWGSGACLPSSLFFFSSGKGFCAIMICWLTSWFRPGFRCLSPLFSLLSFLGTGVLFHHDLLVPLGSGWGSGACLPSSLFFLSSGQVVSSK